MTPHLQSRACWPVVLLWVSSIAQYSFRYILQVNDPNTSHLYRSTPEFLSAFKYDIFIVFALYALYCFFHRRVSVTKRYANLLTITAVGVLVLTFVLLLRMAALHGDMKNTLLCALELIPWITAIFFTPLVIRPDHSVAKTLAAFERVTFWVALPFWIMTVILAALGIRYPALSYPGLLVRCGGIVDDPNGYACLCLLLFVLATATRTGAWRARGIAYLVMLIGTLSLSGYATALVMLASWLLLRLVHFRASFGLRTVRVAAICGILLSVVPLFVAGHRFENATNAIDTIYSAKSRSAVVHISDLSPTESMLDDSSTAALLIGTGGFSENLYWRILVNFGLTGLLVVVGLSLLWSYHALWRIKRWRSSVGIWGAGFVIGSNGIAYLLTFPLSLLYWSLLALLCMEVDNRTDGSALLTVFRSPGGSVQQGPKDSDSSAPIAARHPARGLAG